VKVPFADLNLQHKYIKRRLEDSVNKVISRGDFILGQDVHLFEKEFAGYCGAPYAAGVSSGTAALCLALASIDIKKGDEVIVPAFTYIATALAVSYTQAKPVFVDIDEKTYNIDSRQIKKAITKNTRAIIPVHLFGRPADMPQIIKIAREYNLKIIEDAAQAHGAKIMLNNKQCRNTGTLGDIAAFSFYPSKNLGAMGDGGIILTANKRIYEKLLMLRDYGRVSKYEHALIGYNSRLDTLQAAILRVKLKKLNLWNDLRRKAAGMYNNFLKDIPGITIPSDGDNIHHVYHAYTIRSRKRDEIAANLRKNNVASIIYYPIPLHLQKAYSGLGYRKGDFPVSEKISRDILALPIYPYITEKQIKFITDIIKRSMSNG